MTPTTGDPLLDREILKGNGPDDDPGGDETMLSTRLLSLIVVTILALLVVVVVVGVARNNLDTTGVATVLSTLFSGIVVGTLLKGRKGDPP